VHQRPEPRRGQAVRHDPARRQRPRSRA
jgi:hypothetical protein